MTSRRRALLSGGAVCVIVLLFAVVGWAGPLAGSPDDATTPVDPGPSIRFEEASDATGFDYDRNPNSTYSTTGRAGVFVSDVENDGFPDLLAIGGDRPVLYENSGGTFEPARTFTPEGTVKSALFFDYDADGDDDLLLLRIDYPPAFYENRGGAFDRTDVGLESLDLTIPTAASAADYNDDGCLDLVIAQNGEWRDTLPKRERMVRGAPGEVKGGHVHVPPGTDNGLPNYLLRGNCRTFENVTAFSGIEGARWTTTVSFVDLTGDGLPDVHFANDYNFDYLYVNRGNGTFDSHRIEGTNRHAMSSEVADFNRDGSPDVFVTNIRIEHSFLLDKTLRSLDNRGNNLLINLGNGSFASREERYGVATGGWGWAAIAVDLNNDGDRDLMHATQYYLNQSISDLAKTYPRVWERRGDAYERLNGSRIGLERTNGLGMAHLDFDRDGDQDVAIANRAGEFRLFENRVTGGHWLQVRVRGEDGRTAIGARVRVRSDGATSYGTVNAKVDFLSQDTRVLHFGLSTAEAVSLRVTWPDGRVRTFENVSVDRRIVVAPNGSLATAGR